VAQNRPSNAEVARRAIALLVRELVRRGASARPLARGQSRNWLRVTLPDRRQISVFVSARRRGDWQTSTEKGRSRGEDPQETEFWVFVDLKPEPAEFAFAPAWWVENDIHEEHMRYLARHGGRRAVNPDATHHRIQPARIERWRHRWDVIGLDSAVSDRGPGVWGDDPDAWLLGPDS
jgi:hypothetical protein